MEIKTRVFLNKVKRGVKELVPWIPAVFTGLTFGAAWSGYKQSRRNAKAIKTIQANEQVFAGVINHNADCSDRMRKDLDDLMKKAMDITEGKEPPAA